MLRRSPAGHRLSTLLDAGIVQTTATRGSGAEEPPSSDTKRVYGCEVGRYDEARSAPLFLPYEAR